MNALSETMVMGHAVDAQILYGNDPIAIHQTAALLVREVITPESNALMHPGNSFAMLTPLRCALSQFRVVALYFGKGFLFLAEKAGRSNRFTCRERSKRFESYVNTDSRIALGQTLWFTRNREAGVPLACRGAAYRQGLDRAFDLPMQDDLDMPDPGSVQFALLIDLEARLGVGDAIVAIGSFEAGKAWVFCLLADSTEECLERQVDPHSHVLQDLRMDRFESRTLSFEDRKRLLLLVERQALACLLVGFFAFGKQVVIQPTALFKRLIELGLLLFGRIDAILIHFTHVCVIAENTTVVKRRSAPMPQAQTRNAAFLPVFENRGFQRRRTVSCFKEQGSRQ